MKCGPRCHWLLARVIGVLGIVSVPNDEYAIPQVYVGQGGHPGNARTDGGAGHMWGRCWILGGRANERTRASADDGPILTAGRSVLGRLLAHAAAGRAVRVLALA